MSTTTDPPPIVTGPSQPFGAKRVLLLAAGSIGVLVALGLLATGSAAAWGLTQRDAGGYFTSGGHQLSTSSYALVSNKLHVGTDAPDWAFRDHFATIRIEASGSQPLFIGIARTSAVTHYLANVPHVQVTNFDTDPFSISYRHTLGNAAPARPASQSFWRIKASGNGTRTISWPLEKGNWSAVAMNSNGSRGVSANVRVGARVPFLRWVAIGFLAAGALILVLGTALIYLGARRPRALRRL
jgi:hypothetical protein